MAFQRRRRALDRERHERRALNARTCAAGEDAHANVTLTRAAFDAMILKEGDPLELFASGAITVDGDGAKLGELLGLLDEGDSAFAIVTP